MFSPDILNGLPSEVQDRRGQNGFHRMEDIQEVQDSRCKNGFHGLDDMQEVQGDIGEMQDMHLCTPAVKTQVTIFWKTLDVLFVCVVTKTPMIFCARFFSRANLFLGAVQMPTEWFPAPLQRLLGERIWSSVPLH